MVVVGVGGGERFDDPCDRGDGRHPRRVERYISRIHGLVGAARQARDALAEDGFRGGCCVNAAGALPFISSIAQRHFPVDARPLYTLLRGLQHFQLVHPSQQRLRIPTTDPPPGMLPEILGVPGQRLGVCDQVHLPPFPLHLPHSSSAFITIPQPRPRKPYNTHLSAFIPHLPAQIPQPFLRPSFLCG